MTKDSKPIEKMTFASDVLDKIVEWGWCYEATVEAFNLALYAIEASSEENWAVDEK